MNLGPISLGELHLDNPVLCASGTFGSGLEGQSFSALSRLGGLVSKTVTLKPRPGNPPPRIIETPSGMLNSIGLENRGAEVFARETLPRMLELGPPVILNIGGETMEEFVDLAERFSPTGVAALEANLSCPNVQGGRLYFSTVPDMAEEVMRRIKAVAKVPVFAKLSPNVTNIVEIAQAVERGGADGITAINTLIGMAVDWRRRRPVLGCTIGGLSGPAIKPVALRMVYEIRKVVDLPIMGVGGISSAEDVLEFLAAGAHAVQVGTANFVDPTAMVRTLDELQLLLDQAKCTVGELTGALLRQTRQEVARP